jgi:4'-phosphopantetheinyl transferase
VWTVRLDQQEKLTPPRLAWLDESERARASRFYSPEYANRWRVAHVALRGILASVTGLQPAALRFSYDRDRKPRLDSQSRVRFNLTHSADIALVAVSDGAEVGVDVEQLRPVPEMEGVAASHFAPEEQAALWSAPDGERLATFYRIWTRKESYVKATGVGIGPALARFAVTADDGFARLLYAHDTPNLDDWTLHALSAPETYIAALCVSGSDTGVEFRDWD